jgi:hypothetical protein
MPTYGVRMSMDLATITADHFEPRLNDTFTLRVDGGEPALTLAEVRRLGQALRPGGAFALTFVAPSGASVLPQAIYALSHPVLGALEIFLVPIGPVPGGMGYEAVFT